MYTTPEIYLSLLAVEIFTQVCALVFGFWFGGIIARAEQAITKKYRANLNSKRWK